MMHGALALLSACPARPSFVNPDFVSREQETIGFLYMSGNLDCTCYAPAHVIQ